ncbi:MAG TPA: hypothetical protein VFF32_05800 [Dermatophilaceae bacterium]|nr:hypothetical protein [Dermatophilaceae bacterium]
MLPNELLAQVSAKGWIAAKVEVTPAIPLPVALSSAPVRAMRAATGTLILVDELQEASPADLTAVNTAVHDNCPASALEGDG